MSAAATRLGWRRTAITFVLAACAGIAASAGAFGGLVDEGLRTARDSLRAGPASGELLIAEIDAQTLSVVDRWPWPRSLHGRLVDRLRLAGVRSIAFDVDFSARSTPDEDRAFAGALERFGGSAVLPTFRQASGFRRSRETENLPIAELAAHSFLGAVNVTPARDGMIRHYDYGQITGGVTRPSIAALIAGSAGEVGARFRIDQAFDPASIPRASVIDIVEGRVPAAMLAGKRILIGATAIELGDRYAVPRHGVLPGVVVQAVAAETLLAGRDGEDRSPLPLLLASLLLIAAMLRWTRLFWPLAAGGAMLFGMGLPLAAEMTASGLVPAAPALAAIAAAAVVHATAQLLASLRRSRLTDATGMANQRALVEAITTRRRSAEALPLHVLAVRISRIEELLATLDEQTRDLLRERLAERIAMAAGGATVHRVDRGLYAVAVPGMDREEAERLAEGLAALLRERFALAGRDLALRCHIGVAGSDGSQPAGALVEGALQAAHAAEDAQLPWAAWSSLAADKAIERAALVAEVDAGLDAGQFVIAIQPKIALDTGRPMGAEALARWDHPVRGMVSPGMFLPIIEHELWLDRLTLAVLDAAIAAQRELALHGGPALPLFLNVSARLIGDAEFMARLAARIAGCGLPARLIGIELTESETLESPERAAERLAGLRALGCPVAIDDYGTGQATLSYIQRLPADEIKIDQSFVRRLTVDRGDQILVRSTIEMAHLVGLKVVAEGIEDAATEAMLVGFGCDAGQGWLYARAMAPADYRDWLAGGQEDRRAA